MWLPIPNKSTALSGLSNGYGRRSKQASSTRRLHRHSAQAARFVSRAENGRDDSEPLSAPRGEYMGAKRKLNASHFEGALAVSALAGVLSESFAVFWITLAGLLIASVMSGEIRR